MRSAAALFAWSLLSVELFSTVAFSATPTARIGVTATVQASCLISASTTTSRINTDATMNASTISVACTRSTPYSIGLDAGSVTGATIKRSGPTPASAGHALVTKHSPRIVKQPVDGTIGDSYAKALAVQVPVRTERYALQSAHTDTVHVIITY